MVTNLIINENNDMTISKYRNIKFSIEDIIIQVYLHCFQSFCLIVASQSDTFERSLFGPNLDDEKCWV